jgi:hypothetical protein
MEDFLNAPALEDVVFRRISRSAATDETLDLSTAEIAAMLLEQFKVPRADEDQWQLAEMRFREHCARRALEDEFERGLNL